MSADLRDQLQSALGAAYTIERELGGGGMSRVFVATETALGRKVVVKVLPPDLAAELSVERFRREIQVAAQLQNPHIVPLLSAGEGAGLLYYTMPFVDGETLRGRLARDGELPVAEAVKILRDVAKALAYAHRNGVVHRDIKPENILLSDGEALVADFGVAKALSASATSGGGGLTSIGMALGTPAYMAPEQALADQSADHRVDLYALGAVAYEMLTGQGMFPGRSPQALIAAHTTETPESVERRRPNIPPPLATLVMRMLAKRPADRPQSADEVVRALDDSAISAGTGLSVAAAAPTRGGLFSLPRFRLALGFAILVFLAGGVSLAVTRARRVVPVARNGDVSIAVLPFVNMSGDKENEYFSDGMTEELIDRLANLHSMHVAARTSSFAFKGKDVDVREIGRQLGVHSVVEGSVRRSGSQVRITAQLIDADSGYHRWSHTYDGDLRDVFALQEQIGNAIAGELNVVLAAHDSAALARAPTADTAAHRLYLEGLHFWNQRTARSLALAIGAFRAAVARDAKFADAYAGLAEAYAVMPFYANVPIDSMNVLVLEMARTALALDSTLAAPHAAICQSATGRFEWALAERECRAAVTLAPNDAIVRQWLGELYEELGRRDEALSELQRAVALDPLAPVHRNSLGGFYYGTRRYAEAEAEYRETIQLDPSWPTPYGNLGTVLVFTGRVDSGVALLRRSVELDQPDPFVGTLAWYGWALALAGRTDSALAMQRLIERTATGGHAGPGAMAIIALGLGQRDRAMGEVERAIAMKDPIMSQMFPSDPVLDPIRDDPRFARLKRQLHLP